MAAGVEQPCSSAEEKIGFCVIAPLSLVLVLMFMELIIVAFSLLLRSRASAIVAATHAHYPISHLI